MAVFPSSAASRAAWRVQGAWRRLQARRLPKMSVRELHLTSQVGYRIVGQLATPEGAGPLPGLVISPAIHAGIRVMEGVNNPVNASEIAALGFAVLTLDPAGRGESWGEEDFGGLEHQDNVRIALEWMLKDGAVDGTVGVLSLSLGVAAAVGALAGSKLPVRWLVDWEGPSDREIITAGGTIMVPAAGHALADDSYWRPREAVRTVHRLRCGYVRLQANPDHAQPSEVRHAERMIRAASSGNLPFFQINDHPRNEVPTRALWHAGGPFSANTVILRKLRALR